MLAACQTLTQTQAPNDSERMFAAFSNLYDADPADPSMVEDLAKFCDGWQAAHEHEQEAGATANAFPLKMRDRPGAPTVARIREAFEKSIADTPALQAHTDCQAVMVEGVFSHYANVRTDILWIGFALGMRAAAMLAEEERQKPDSTLNVMARLLHDQITANQAAWIEWQHGAGAEAAMAWVQNGLIGPGHIPDEDEPYGREAQAWFDANCAEPLPQCFCGRPSNIGWMAQGFCCKAHHDQASGERAKVGAGCRQFR
ncbi:hypothetical protein NS331_22615 [Pseudacidovorax intermedius]|uniref:Uncharacterized protein n=1 Tax=Pseudacidovorax intermedius TaxID=433924 RepID=A0A147GM88_9BURK|nr:hypothetical protein NS331_22615 [Pseudacidovorax intermedius]